MLKKTLECLKYKNEDNLVGGPKDERELNGPTMIQINSKKPTLSE
jgi:hypothetical protein